MSQMNSSVFNKISLYLQSKQVVPGVVVAVDTPKLSRTYVWGRHSGLDSPHVSANTIFDLASISKLYTCLYALKLCDKGILNLAAKCSEYLDVFHRSNLTLMDLLTHRANFNVRLADYRLNHPNDLAYHIFNIIPPKEAENNVFYENITYLYVGKIIESVTGKSLGENLKSMLAEYTFSQTFLGSELDKHKIIAPPTEQFGNLLIENITHDETARMLGGIAGNAGIFASANDLIKFGKIWLHNNGFLNIDIKDISFKNYSPENSLPQGLGWWNRIQGLSINTPELFSHSGFTGGIIIVNPSALSTCVVLTNRTLYGRDNKAHHFIWHLLANEMRNQ